MCVICAMYVINLIMHKSIFVFVLGMQQNQIPYSKDKDLAGI